MVTQRTHDGTSHVSSQPPAAPATRDSLWRLMNAAKPIEPGAMRVTCGVFLVVYGAIAFVRYEESHQAFFWLRLLVCSYAAFGIWLASRVTWTSARLYTVGLAFVLPLQAAYVDGMLGNGIAEVAVTALATFVPLVFMQAGWDLIFVVVGLVAGHALVLAVVPAPTASLAVVTVMLGGAMATGTAAGLQALMYRGRSVQSLREVEQALAESAAAQAMAAEEAMISGALARVGRELISSLETPVVLERLCRLTSEVLGCGFSQTWLWRADEQVYTPIASYGTPDEQWDVVRALRVSTDPTTPLFAQLLRDDTVQVTPTSAEYPLIAGMLAYYGVGVVLCVALRRGDDLVGVHVAGYRARTDPFTPTQDRIARGIGQLAAMALTNAQLVEELERASRLKSEFVSTMSHELRTPLNVILGYTDMLADQVAGEGQRMLLRRVRQSGLELLELIEATLDINRLAAGTDVPQLGPVRLAELWDELAMEFNALARKPDVTVCWEPVGVEILQTDRRKLKMILKNLVGNALKFTSEGAVVVKCGRCAEGAEITVHDTGIGIAAEHVPYLFDMFRQVDSSDRRSYGGAGLGLYIVRQLAHQLGGTVTVDSTPGCGSTFRVMLPTAVESSHVAA